jgi:hypothetical protein
VTESSDIFQLVKAVIVIGILIAIIVFSIKKRRG